MSDFSISWVLSRQRFVDEISGLSDEQLRWKPHGGCLSIGQSALHVAGVEVSFATQILGRDLSEAESKLKKAATEGVVNDHPFPFEVSEITPQAVSEALATSKKALEALIVEPSEAVLTKQIQSALGPVITGQGALARLAFHPAYHQGQAYLFKTSPDFPSK